MCSKEEINLRHQYVLNNAMAVEQLLGPKIAAHPLRQLYHVMPPVNWMNDPCSMVWFKGYYHLLYQYDPYHISPRGMFFGHVRSTDLVHWEQLPIALGPSEPWELYDRDEPGKNFGIFTGSAAVEGDRLIIAYCGSSYDEEGKLVQTICLAFSTDGIHFEKYEKNPIIAAPPEDGSRDFRDPKLWKQGDKWYLLMGSCKDGQGKVLLYTSDTLEDWTYMGVMAESDGSFGRMWECPDFFELDGYDVLIFSPIGMHHVDACWQIGHMDYSTGKFQRISWGKLDYGKEFYAPQTLLSPDGRRIMIGWCNMWAHDGRDTFTTFGATAANGWCGHMSLPRELHVDERQRLTVTPVSECQLLRQGTPLVCRYTLCGTSAPRKERETLSPGEGSVIQKAPFDGWKSSELCLTIQAESQQHGKCGVRVRGGNSNYTEIGWDSRKNAVYLDRRNADGIYNDIQYYDRETTKAPTITIYTDSVGIELFADNGKIRATNNIYPNPEHTELTLFAKDMDCVMTLEAWQLL